MRDASDGLSSAPLLTRDQLFSFAAWLLWQRASAFTSSGNDGIKPTYALVFHRFFDAFPPAARGHGFQSLHARLLAGPYPERMRQFIEWLQSNGTRSPGLSENPQGEIWAFARIWQEFAAILKAAFIRPATAVRPNPWLKTVTPRIARDALWKLMTDPSAEPDGNGEARQILEAAVEDWRRRTLKMPWNVPCPACSVTPVNPLIAANHVPRCPSHPGYQRQRAAEEALALAVTVAREQGLPQPSLECGKPAPREEPKYVPQPNETGDYHALQEIERLAAQKGPGDLAPSFEHIQVLLTEWEHLVDRATDPCPCCNAVVDLDAMIPHLLACPSHPGQREAERVEAAIAAVLGPAATALIGLAGERNAFREELHRLFSATEEYAADMHWGSDTGAYSKPEEEKPWRAAQARAAALVERARPASEPGVFSESDPLAGVRDEVERFASALAGLVKANGTYWARMGDGDGGRSIEDPAQVPQWEAARKAARKVLAESGCLETTP
jgi:hypothetical protein